MKITLLVLTLICSTSFANQKSNSPIQPKMNVESGFLLKDISSTSLLKKLGLESSDKITHINGKKIKTLSELMSEAPNIKSLTIIRNGKAKTLNYNFEK
ncbi:hypothetical protein HBN50_11605 [Halobacteriovorax sp. GB3]|uniref:hypothetical protein n=1 Tax=Halobacteriovorax sp. GB3 TaxID=2719615 RepID=UPI00235DE8C3|nr:hypothetical protein [Halobacteriovorax sp. GB3]MDD0853747.1 hypothetical protein [Halobacteriovorax sp. GB3]